MRPYVIFFLGVVVVVVIDGRPEKTVESVKETVNRMIDGANETSLRISQEKNVKKSSRSTKSVNAVQLTKDLPLGYKILIDLDVRLKEPEVAQRSVFVVNNKTEIVGDSQLLSASSERTAENDTKSGGSVDKMASREQDGDYEIHVTKTTKDETVKDKMARTVLLSPMAKTKKAKKAAKTDVSLRSSSDYGGLLDVFEDNNGDVIRSSPKRRDFLEDYIDRSFSSGRICRFVTSLYDLLKADDREDDTTKNNNRKYRADSHENIFDWLRKNFDLF